MSGIVTADTIVNKLSSPHGAYTLIGETDIRQLN